MAAAPPPGWGNPTAQAPQPPAGWSTTPGQGGQSINNQPVQMGQQPPSSPPAPTFPVVWPNGIGFTSRDLSDGKDPKSCRPFCGCCLLPYQFHDKDMTMHGEPGKKSLTCKGFEMNNADLIGKRFNFDMTDGPLCCSDEVHVYEEGQLISKTVIKHPMNPSSWKCDVEDIVTVSDAAGNEKFARRDSVCCQKNFGRYSHDGNVCWGWKQIRHPFYKANSQVKLTLAKAVGFVTYRYHSCVPCYYEYLGFDEVPNTITPEEQKMILGLLLDPTVVKAPADNTRN